MELNIRRGEQQDIAEILAVLAENLMANQTSPDATVLQKTGFLMHGFTAEDVEAALKDKNYIVLVACHDDLVVGYAMSFDLNAIKPAAIDLSQVSTPLQTKLSAAKVLYHRHIAKKTGFNNVGSRLLETLFSLASSQGYKYVVCSIAHLPLRNYRSIELHERLGFSLLCSTCKQDLTYGIYMKELP